MADARAGSAHTYARVRVPLPGRAPVPVLGGAGGGAEGPAPGPAGATKGGPPPPGRPPASPARPQPRSLVRVGFLGHLLPV